VLRREPGFEAPSLPPSLDGGPWHSMTQQWWDDLWDSPMAPEYDDSDRHGLFLLAVLVDGFWRSPSKELAAEIRLQRQCFGLTPIDRRRLQWTIPPASDDDKGKGASRRGGQPDESPKKGKGDDTYRSLRAVV
jgi:hypothetical protein